MTATMVRQVHSFEVFGIPWMELLRHGFIVHLVQDHIKFVKLCKDAHFKLTSPCAILPNRVNIVIDCHVTINVELVFILVGF